MGGQRLGLDYPKIQLVRARKLPVLPCCWGTAPAARRHRRIVVIADLLFTATAVVAQPVTGALLAWHMGSSLSESWIAASIALYIVTGDFWLPLVWMQMRMRDLVCEATAANKPLSVEITACSGCGSSPTFRRLPLCWRSSG
jgi:hypothetical protein